MPDFFLEFAPCLIEHPDRRFQLPVHRGDRQRHPKRSTSRGEFWTGRPGEVLRVEKRGDKRELPRGGGVREFWARCFPPPRGGAPPPPPLKNRHDQQFPPCCLAGNSRTTAVRGRLRA